MAGRGEGGLESAMRFFWGFFLGWGLEVGHDVGRG